MRPLLLLLLLGCGPKRAPKSQGPLPTADALFARNLEAIGGPAALKRANYVAYGTLSMPKQGLSGTIEVRVVCPDQNLTLSTVPGIGAMQTGVLGSVGWATDQLMGPRLMGDKQATQTRRSTHCEVPARWAEDYPQRETKAAEKLDDKDTFRVEAVGTEGLEHVFWFDAATGHIVAQRDQMASEMGTMPVTSTFEDFRAIGGLVQPMRVTQKMGPISMVIQLDRVATDLATPPDLQPPPEVLSLLPAAPGATP
jgi:hypothetical protein